VSWRVGIPIPILCKPCSGPSLPWESALLWCIAFLSTLPVVFPRENLRKTYSRNGCACCLDLCVVWARCCVAPRATLAANQHNRKKGTEQENECTPFGTRSGSLLRRQPGANISTTQDSLAISWRRLWPVLADVVSNHLIAGSAHVYSFGFSRRQMPSKQ